MFLRRRGHAARGLDGAALALGGFVSADGLAVAAIVRGTLALFYGAGLFAALLGVGFRHWNDCRGAGAAMPSIQ